MPTFVTKAQLILTLFNLLKNILVHPTDDNFFIVAIVKLILFMISLIYLILLISSLSLLIYLRWYHEIRKLYC